MTSIICHIEWTGLVHTIIWLREAKKMFTVYTIGLLDVSGYENVELKKMFQLKVLKTSSAK